MAQHFNGAVQARAQTKTLHRKLIWQNLKVIKCTMGNAQDENMVQKVTLCSFHFVVQCM